MNRILIGAALALSLGACKYDKEGVFLMYLPYGEDLICDATISENITDADPPDEVTTTDSEWVITDEATRSDALTLAQLFQDRSGNVLFQFGSTLYVGTEDGGIITVSWVNENDSTYREEHAESGYEYEETDTTTVENTITLTKNKDTKGYAGNWKTSITSTRHWGESDEWDDLGYYQYAGQINTTIQAYLVGGASNTPTQTDCDSNPCEIDVTSICDGSYNFEMVETDLDSDAYDGVEGAGQPNGVIF